MSMSNLIKFLTIFIIFVCCDSSMQAAVRSVAEQERLNKELLKVAVPIFKAITSDDNFDKIKTLLAEGADPNVVGQMGVRPLHIAQTERVAELLLDAGADPKAVNEYGATPLHLAKTGAIAKLLLNAGADVNAVDKYGKTPLHNAQTEKIAKLLLDAGADPNASNFYGEKPIHTAAKVLNTKVVKTLLDNGAEVTDLNSHGQNIDGIATTYGYQIRQPFHPEIKNIRNLYKKYLPLYRSSEAVKERNTLFGKTVMYAYDKYVDDNDPTLLADMLGVSEVKEVSPLTIRKAKNMFVLYGKKPILDENGEQVINNQGKPRFEYEHTGEPMIIDQLRQDYQKHLEAVRAKTVMPESTNIDVR